MKTKYVIVVMAALCGWLFFADSAQAQLARVWSQSLFSYGTKAGVPLVDDSGNVYALNFPGSAYTGARVTKLKNDGTLDWQSDYLYAGLELNYFGLGPDGSTYVVGHAANYSWGTLVIGIKFDPMGNFAWEQPVAPLEAPYFGYFDPTGAVDPDGNLWVGVTESPTDSLCIDSLPGSSGETGGAIPMSKAVVYRLHSQTGIPFEVQRIDGGIRRPSMVLELIGNGDGYVCARVRYLEYCCNNQCQNCRDSCFAIYGSYQHENSYYRTIDELWKFTDAGGLSGVIPLGSSDTEVFESAFRVGRSGEIFIKQDVYSSDLTRSDSRWNRIGFWSNTLQGGADNQSQYVTDYRGNILLLQSTSDDGDPANITQTCYLDGQTGAVRWVKPYTLGISYGGDRDGNVFIIGSGWLHKFDEWGSEIWSYHSPVGIYSFVSCDTAGGYYFIGGGGFAKYTDRKYLTIRDVHGDSLPEMEFALYRVRNNPPTFSDTLLGSFTTDDMGRLKLELLPNNKFLLEDDGGNDTLALNDTLKIVKYVMTEPARKHEGVLGTMYNLYLDNMQIDDNGAVSWLELDDQSNQDVTMNHTEYRYNLLVSVEWDAEMAYLQGVEQGIRAASNFLYDVTDGQMRFDTIMLFDGDAFQAEADMRILANNMHNPNAMYNGIYHPGWCTSGWNCGYPMSLPRKWYGDPNLDRDSTYVHHPLYNPVSDDYRSIVHEFGHYALNFYDEYVFYDAVWNLLGAGARCQLRPAGNAGFMDYQYDNAIGGPHASEMSSKYRYVDPTCRYTFQYRIWGQSCWDLLESWAEGVKGEDQIEVPILKPDINGDPERQPKAGFDYFIGPNDNLAAPDYDVGGRVVFPNGVSSPPATTRSLHITVDHSPPGGVTVTLKKLDYSGNYYAIAQGRTIDLGPMWVLGADRLRDMIDASAHTWSVTTPPGIAAASLVNYTKTWMSGRLDLSTTGESDSLEMSLTPVSGNLPMIVRLSCDTDENVVSLISPVILANPPYVMFMSTGLDNIGGTMIPATDGYGVSLSGESGSEGVLQFEAEDDLTQPFFFEAYYVNRGYEGAGHIVSGPGMMKVDLDTSNSTIERVTITSCAYPGPLTGLGNGAIQAGLTQAISVTPEQTLTGHNILTIGYTDAELMVDDNLMGDESTLQVYAWDTSSDEWVLVGGVVDMEENAITTLIPGSGVYAAFTTNIITDVEDDPTNDVLPYRFELFQNYPNPFNPTTTIEYSLPERSRVVIDIYNLLGRRVMTLVDREQAAGSYSITWNGTDANGRLVATGVYLYRFRAGEHVETKKMLLLK